MDQDETKMEPEVKKPARKRTPRKKAEAAAPATGDVGIPAASAEPTPAKPRRKTTKKPAAAEPPAAPAAEPAAPAPEQNTPAPAAAEARPQRTRVRTRTRVAKSNTAPRPQETPAAPQPEPAPAPMAEEFIPEPAEPANLPPAPGFAAPETVGGGEGGSNGGRRKRRRNRNRRGNNEGAQPQQQAQQNPKVDADELVRRAWKIYLGEVTEDGLALMDDRTAAEAARRAFRVAELFLIEASRHRPSSTTPEEAMPDAPEDNSAPADNEE